MKMHLYEIGYDIKRNHTETHFSERIPALNAKEARKKFDDWYWAGCKRRSDKSHPFHITVRRLMNGVIDEHAETI